jgi:signal transduction histidine kinase
LTGRRSLFQVEGEVGAPDEGEGILVIDDDHAMRLSCRKILERAGFRVETFENGSRGLEALSTVRPALIVVDLKMPGISGMEVVRRVHELDPEIIIVVITGYATIDTAVEAMQCGAYDFLPKPFSPEELRLIVRRGLDRRRLALESHRAELEREMLRRRFVTFVSHQLQSPLSAIHQYISVLKELGDTEDAAAKRQEWFERCLRRTAEMQSLIRDWLTVAKADCQGLAKERVAIDLRTVIPLVLDAYKEIAAAEEVTLDSRLPEELCLVRGDRHCLRELLDNLVGNAIKYNRPGGKVVVTAGPVDGEVQVVVSDTGVGIPEKYQRLLFQEFFRVGAEEGKRTSGSGLGLAICKRIVSEMGGSISVESQANAGSTFRVRLLKDPGPVGGNGLHD